MGADINFLKRNGMYEQYKKFNRIVRLNEYVNYRSELEEEGEEELPQGEAAPQQGQDPMGGAPDGQTPPQGADPMAGGDGQTPQGQDPMGGAPDGQTPPQGADPMAGDPNAAGQVGDPMMGGMPNDPMMGGAPMDGMGEQDEVIDVDDITKAQEKTNSKVNTIGRDVEGMDNKFTELMSKIDSLTQQLDSQNKEIEDFKAEFAKRNPTPKEKLEQRAKSSFPFSETVDSYWEKNTPDNYDRGGEETGEKVYELDLDGDIDDMNDNDIERSFMVPESLKYDIKRIFSE